MKRAASFTMADIEWLRELKIAIPGADADTVEVAPPVEADANPDPYPVAVAVATPQSTAAGSVAVAVPVAVAGPAARPGHTLAWYGLVGLGVAVAVFVAMMLV